MDLEEEEEEEEEGKLDQATAGSSV